MACRIERRHIVDPAILRGDDQRIVMAGRNGAVIDYRRGKVVEPYNRRGGQRDAADLSDGEIAAWHAAIGDVGNRHLHPVGQRGTGGAAWRRQIHVEFGPAIHAAGMRFGPRRVRPAAVPLPLSRWMMMVSNVMLMRCSVTWHCLFGSVA